MLKLKVGSAEGYDEKSQTFVTQGGIELEFEHSLVSLSKWEAKWEVPFLGSEKTEEQIRDYIHMMIMTPGVPASILDRFTADDLNQVMDYIKARRSATWVKEVADKSGVAEIVTAEVIYYWMITQQIPLDFENRHLNHLLTLIRVISQKSAEAGKKTKGPTRSTRSNLESRKALNAQRKAQMGTTG